MSLVEDLLKNGAKLTLQRKLIAEKIDRQKTPFSAEDLHSFGLKQKRIDLVTIYRTLTLFHNLGLLHKSEFGDRKSRYWKSTNNNHCQTLFCRKCGQIETLPTCLVESQHESLSQKGYTELSHRVEFVGICPECSQKNKISRVAT